MNELKAVLIVLFFVIGIPLLYLVISLLVTIFFAKKTNHQIKRISVILICLIVFAVIPVFDEIPNRLYYKHICETDGGVKVFKTIKLSPEYYTEGGNPKYLTANGSFDESALGNKYKFINVWDRNFNKTYNIAKDYYQITEVSTGEILGTETSFVYFKGWLANNLPFAGPASGIRCHSMKDGIYKDFLIYIFK